MLEGLNLLKGKRIALFVTGSVAAYKAIYLLRMFRKNGVDVKAVMTPFAEKFVSKLTFQVLSKNDVYDDQSYFDDSTTINHIGLAKWADLAVIVPATANFIAKTANGIADNFASTTLLAMDCPKYYAPAMNDVMLDNPATQRNIMQLKHDGIHFIAPKVGLLAEGYSANGRMAEPEEIYHFLDQNFIDGNSKPLDGVNLLVTAGGTREPIDPVRYLSNKSSGKMGYAIAEVAQRMGANVTLISANSHCQVPSGVKVINVYSAAQLEQQVQANFPHNRVLIMAAAVSDFKPDHVSSQKIKKDLDHDSLDLHLIKNHDVVSRVAKTKKPDQIVIGFAAETNHPVENATQKLKQKHLDLIVLNDVSNSAIGFNSDNNQVSIISDKGLIKKTNVESKSKIAKEILEILCKRLN
ncbi:phosphopantothenoylcysteine decarboxylase phosphopantothenate cysteine ligase [Fructilactobacillus fructivorans]|nr:phosphopantothenoylcysteine decarboxylase phosphopantothenate cysteine ligase [Fructilactobacillus fructivorans]